MGEIERDRRTLLKLLVAAGLLAPGTGAGSQEPGGLTPEVLERALTLFEGDLEAHRLRAILPAVQRNVDFFRLVRELDVPDEVEPAPIFHADRPGGE